MATALDELRSTLLNRQQPQRQAAQPSQGQPQAPLQARPQGPASSMVSALPGVLMGKGDGGEAVSTKQPQPEVINKLSDAIGGGTAGAQQPNTGMTPPAWPPTPMPMGPAEIPIGLPNESARVPPRWQRFQTAQRMQDAIRNDYNPNPMLVRILSGGR